MKREIAKIEPPFNDIDFLNIWGDWVLYRKQRHLANYTPVGLKRTFAKLKEDANNDVKIAIQIIEQSLAMSWQGLFPLKNSVNGKSNTTKQQPVTNEQYKNAVDKFAARWQ